MRNENRSLRCIADHLEVESASLAETLVRWQVERAHGAETEYALAQQLADAQRRLQAALLARREHDQEVHINILQHNKYHTFIHG